MNETQRKRRGHAFLPPKAVLRRIPALFATEGTTPFDKTIWAHYFAGGSDYYIAELDQETCEAYGYTRHASHPDGAEWGYIDLSELEQVRADGFVHIGVVRKRVPGLVIIERDMHWKPCKFSEIKEVH